MHFTEITDVRDGLNPQLRQTLSILKNELHGYRFRRSSKVLRVAADALGTNVENIYDALVDAMWPRSKFPLVDGLGMFGFPVADSDFSEIRLSNFCTDILSSEANIDFDCPFPIPIPFVLINGTIGYFQSITKIPTHNLGEVIDASIALIKNPKLDTKQLLQIIKGPDLLVGGRIENLTELYDIYESGKGNIKMVVTPDSFNDYWLDNPKDYSTWYGMRARKIRNKDAYRIEIPYYAYLSDGTQTRFMSLKDILQSFIDHYRTMSPNISDEELCLSLLKYKENASSRMTYAYAEELK